MKTILLSNGLAAKVDDDDYRWLSQFTWQAVKRPTGRGYDAITYYWVKDSRGRPKLVKRRMQHLVIKRPGKHQVDHKNRNSLDNQSENLRPATRVQNCRNRHRPNKCGYKGVNKHPYTGKYGARITTENKKRLFLGWFSTASAASAAYDAAAAEHFGEFAALNSTRKKGE